MLFDPKRQVRQTQRAFRHRARRRLVLTIVLALAFLVQFTHAAHGFAQDIVRLSAQEIGYAKAARDFVLLGICMLSVASLTLFEVTQGYHHLVRGMKLLGRWFSRKRRRRERS